MTDKNAPGLLRSYPTVFWVANVMELFERAAYYGMNSVLAIYLSDSATKGGLGFSEESIGFLQGLIYALTYVVPILGGALADRYGYRRMLIVAFSLLSAGYFVTGHMSAYGAVFLSLLVMATGAGLFKPIISGTIARSTTEANSGFGFGIYYWMINLGAFLAPLVVSYLKGFSWSYVFTASALYCALMLLPTLLLYKDPPKPANTKKLAEVLNSAAMVLADARFMLMIFIYSGFWILYFQNFGSVLWFLRDFIDKAPVNRFFSGLGIPLSFDAEHVTVINAGTIILLQVFVSRIVKNLKPLPTMIGGMEPGEICGPLVPGIAAIVAQAAVPAVEHHDRTRIIRTGVDGRIDAGTDAFPWNSDREIKAGIPVKIARRQSKSEPVIGLGNIGDIPHVLVPDLVVLVYPRQGIIVRGDPGRGAVEDVNGAGIDLGGIIKRDTDAQVAIPVAVEVPGSQSIAELIAGCSGFQNARAVPVPDRVIDRCAQGPNPNYFICWSSVSVNMAARSGETKIRVRPN